MDFDISSLNYTKDLPFHDLLFGEFGNTNKIIPRTILNSSYTPEKVGDISNANVFHISASPHSI